MVENRRLQQIAGRRKTLIQSAQAEGERATKNDARLHASGDSRIPDGGLPR